MVNKEYLNKELDFYKKKNKTLRSAKYGKNMLPKLFNKFKYYGMIENSYCCRGLDDCCWQEVVEEGVWDLTLEDVKRDIERNFKYSKKYLYNQNKYDKRLFKYENKDCCYIYVYLRDKEKYDYAIWFSSKER